MPIEIEKVSLRSNTFLIGVPGNARFKLAPQTGAELRWPIGDQRRGPPGSHRVEAGGFSWSSRRPTSILNPLFVT